MLKSLVLIQYGNMAYDFDTIARDYDRMNHLMTLGLDRWWRKKAVKGLGGKVLDVACGTGDMVVELLRHGCTVTGVDLSKEMLAIAKRKTASDSFQLSTFNSATLKSSRSPKANSMPSPVPSACAISCIWNRD